MAKNNLQLFMTSYGVYSQWDEKSKALPRLVEVTTEIPLRENIEFGFIVSIKKAKNEKLSYCIYHPDIPDKTGQPMPPFTGEVYVKNNNWSFYLGDSVQTPIERNIGHWRLVLSHNDNVIAEKTFIVDRELGGERTLGEGRTFFKPKKRW